MTKVILIITVLTIDIFCQSPAFYPVEHWRVSGYGMAFNVEVHDINNDGKQDIIVGNWNDTYVYYGGAGVLDSTVDITYTGRMLAVCDYNGDGYKDLIAMHFTNYDSTRNDYDGEILFYYGSNTTPNIDTIPEYSISLPTLYPTRDNLSVGAGKPGVEYGDFNMDNKIDVAINSTAYNIGGGRVVIYMGHEIPPDTISYSVEGSYFLYPSPVIGYGNFFQISDINEDGYDDLLLSSRILTAIPNPSDSLDVLYIYKGSENFTFYYGEETFKYESRLKDANFSYGWFKWIFSLLDVDGSGISDLVINHSYRDSTNHVHFGSINEIDSIPSFYITDPDTTNPDIIVGQLAHNIGDFNNDGYDDFVLKQAGFKTFSVHLGGPYINNKNPYGLKGLLEAFFEFPSKAISSGDQNGDSIKDFIVTANPYHEEEIGYIIIYKGRDDIVISVGEEDVKEPPFNFNLEQNYPNPFNSSTVIGYQLLVTGKVKITVYDLLGKEITVLINEEQTAGEYRVEFDASKYNLASGIYFCELKIKDGNSSRIKMTYLK